MIHFPKFSGHFRLELPPNRMSPQGVVQGIRVALGEQLIVKFKQVQPQDAFFMAARTRDDDSSARTLDVVVPDRFDQAVIQAIVKSLKKYHSQFRDKNHRIRGNDIQRLADVPDQDTYIRETHKAKRELASGLQAKENHYIAFNELHGITKPDKDFQVVHEVGTIRVYNSF